MTRQTNTKFLLTKKILISILALFMCVSLFLATACNEETSSASEPNYSYSESADNLIKNPTFKFDTEDMGYSDFPKTSVDGWNLSKTATSKSGVIDVSAKGWKEVLSNFVNDSGLMNYVRNINGNFTDSEIKQIIKDAGEIENPTSADVKKYIVDNYLTIPEQKNPDINYPFENPSKPTSSSDNKIYMLNNYTTGSYGIGTAQYLASTTELIIPAGEYAMVSVWVKTDNLNTVNTTNGYNKPIGANIKVKNYFNSNVQSEFGIYNIVDTEWTEYHFYIKADPVYENKFILILGLGYDDYYAEGTAYFDNITVKLLTENEYQSQVALETTSVKTYFLDYGNTDNDKVKVEATSYLSNYHLYDMSLNIGEIKNNDKTLYAPVVNFHNDTKDKKYYDFTTYQSGETGGNPQGITTNVVSIENGLTDIPYGVSSALKVSLTKPASYTIRLDNNGSNFVLASETYASFTFFVKNQLNTLYSTNIEINVQDIYGSTIIERPSVATITEVSDEWTKYTVNVRNNWSKEKYTTEREFYLDIVVGPDIYQSDIDNYAMGTVYISAPFVAKGVTYELDSNNDKTDNFALYQLFSSTYSGVQSLYAGFSDDYTSDESSGENYVFSVAPSDIGTIQSKPATPKGYTGIESGHYYITGDNDDTVNTNTNQYAGLINTKYLDTYSTIPSLSEVKTALNYTATDTHIQPLMIKATNKSYGFISDTYTVVSSDFAKVSLKVRVYNATAYVYLVDTTKTQKGVMTFDSFTVNTSEGKFDNNGDISAQKQLMFEVSPTTLNGEDWITLEFYIATGANSKTFRLELWNGERTAESITTDGYVFFDNVEVLEGSAFTEATRWQDAFTTADTPLYQKETLFTDGNLLTYQRPLSNDEIAYNNDNNKSGENVKYAPTYVWAKSDRLIYAVYNTIEPVVINPYDNEPVEEETPIETTAQTDPATFWLSLSTILLGAALLLAIVMLFIKNIRNRRKANESDAISHYTVKSRIHKQTLKREYEQPIEDAFEEEQEIQTEQIEQTLDDYVYGDVQDFGEESSDND